MNKLITCLIIAVLAVGCSVTTEKYRYKLRFDRFYFLLNNEEKEYFATGELDKVASSLSLRLQNDKNLKERWRDVQFYEAIATFDPYQTAHFFRDEILKELNRDNYYTFMRMLDAKTQMEFALNTNFMVSYGNMYKTNVFFKSLVDSLKTEYRLYGFSDEEVYLFLRHIIFTETSEKDIFYSLLKLLKGCGAIADFKAGNIQAASQKMTADIQNNQASALLFDTIRRTSGLTALSIHDLLQVYSSVVMKEMDPYALSHTLAKF